MQDFKYLNVSYAGTGVADVMLARAPANAINDAMYREIEALFSRPDQIGDGLQVMVLSAEGRHFCGGNDLDEFESMTPSNGDERMRRVRAAFFAIQDCPVPVIGAVRGVALGSGLAIAASCDFLVAARDARFGLPELTVGVMGGAAHLARLAPQGLVRRMFFTGEPLRADALAAATGALIVCDEGEVLDKAHEIALRIAAFSPTAVRLAKRTLNRIETLDLKAGYELEQDSTVRMSGHADSKEALTAFRTKRAPMYGPRQE
jgi:enoyl-CoA hydratase